MRIEVCIDSSNSLRQCIDCNQHQTGFRNGYVKGAPTGAMSRALVIGAAANPRRNGGFAVFCPRQVVRAQLAGGAMRHAGFSGILFNAIWVRTILRPSYRLMNWYFEAGRVMSDADHPDKRIEPVGQAGLPRPGAIAALKPKGACWYCNQPLDNVRRFCSKSCADDYRVEEEAFNPPAL